MTGQLRPVAAVRGLCGARSRAPSLSFDGIDRHAGRGHAADPGRPVGRPRLQGRPVQHRRPGPVPDGRPRGGRVGAALADGPPLVAIPLAILAGDRRQARSTASSRAVLKAFTGAHEVVTTIMLNYIALLHRRVGRVLGPLREPGRLVRPDRRTSATRRCPILGDGRARAAPRASSSPLVAVPHHLVAAVPDARSGFEIRTVGANPDAARYAGMRPRLADRSLTHDRRRPARRPGAAPSRSWASSGYMPAPTRTTSGFDAITVALLGRANPVGILFAGLLFGAMRAGRAADADQGRRPGPDDRRPPGRHPVLPGRRRHRPARLPHPRRRAGGVDELQTITRSYGGQTTGGRSRWTSCSTSRSSGSSSSSLDYLVEVLTLNGPIILALATPHRARRAVRRHERALRRRQHRHRGDDAGQRVRRLVRRHRSSVQVVPGAAQARSSGPRPPLLVGVARGHRHGHRSCPPSTPGCRSPSGRTRSSAARSSTSSRSGVTGYLNLLIEPAVPAHRRQVHDVQPPRARSTDLPVVGWLFQMFLQPGPDHDVASSCSRSSSRCCLFRSRWGLRTRAVGEHPKAAETVGIDVIRLRYRNVILGGMFAGLAGAWFTLELRQLVPERHDQRARVHRAGGAHLRTLDADRRVRARRCCSRRSSSLGHRHPDHRRRRASWATILTLHPGAVLYGAAVHRDHHRAGRRRRRSIPPAAVGKPYERESTDLSDRRTLTAERADRSAPRARHPRRSRRARGPVPLLGDDAAVGAARGRAADRRRRRVAGPWRPSHGVMRTCSPRATTACPSTRTRTPCWAWPRSRPSRPRRRRPGPFDIVDVFRRPEHAPDVAAQRGRGRRRRAVAPAGRRHWEAARIAHDGGLGRGHGPLHRDRAPPAAHRAASRRARPARLQPGLSG